ncbi:MAG: ParA family protein, partial [Phycisphaerae bacterium]
QEWKDRLAKQPRDAIALPQGTIKTIGYMVIRHAIRLDRPVQAFDRWIAKIPTTYGQSVLNQTNPAAVGIDDDPNCIAKLKDYRSLMPLAQEARKPMFHLTPADGALGAHSQAVSGVRSDFEKLAMEIGRRSGLPVPERP